MSRLLARKRALLEIGEDFDGISELSSQSGYKSAFIRDIALHSRPSHAASILLRSLRSPSVETVDTHVENLPVRQRRGVRKRVPAA